MDLESRPDLPDESNIKQRPSNGEMERMSSMAGSLAASEEVTAVFLKDRGKFLNFIRSFVHDPDDAEEILQRSSLRIVERAGALRDSARAAAWIYRVLRNEISDHFRRLSIQSKRTAQLPADLSVAASDRQFDPPRLCPCAQKELAALRPNYSDALQAMEMAGEAITAYARRKGISVNSATVLLYRARKSLRTHLQAHCGPCAGPGCFDCGCRV